MAIKEIEQARSAYLVKNKQARSAYDVPVCSAVSFFIVLDI